MADVKISDLTDGTAVAAGDLVEVERPGSPSVSRQVPLGTAAGSAATAFATAAQGSTADTALQPGDIGDTVQAYDADTLKGDAENQTITGGATITPKDLGTQASGTVTVDLGDCQEQKFNSNGCDTLDVAANVGSAWVQITNGASAVALDVSAFGIYQGDALDTTEGNVFHCLLGYRPNGEKIMNVIADSGNA